MVKQTIIIFLVIVEGPLKPQNKTTNNISAANNTPTTEICQAGHSPFGEETSKRRLSAMIVLIFWGSIYILIRLLISFLREYSSSFYQKSFKSLSKHVLLFYIFMSLILAFHTYGAFDSLKINSEYFVNGIAMFGILWVIFCVGFIISCNYHLNKWVWIEKDLKNKSLHELKESYLNHINLPDENPDKSNHLLDAELIEYYLLKTNFIIPLYPTFKSSLLRKDFNFSKYLENCMLKQLDKFFSFSWISWLFVIFVIFVWDFSVNHLSATLMVINI
jgi:hypothetical protein